MRHFGLPRNAKWLSLRSFMTWADFTDTDEGGARRIRLSGSLSLAVGTLDLSGIDHIDTVGAWVIHRTAGRLDASISGADADAERLIAAVAKAGDAGETTPPTLHPLLRILNQIGGAVVTTGHTMVGLIAFLGATLIASWTLICHPSRIRINAVVQRFEVVGVAALGIIGLMSFLIGIVIAQQGSVQLEQFGMEVLTVNLVGRLTFRELGVLMTAIMVAGRSGSAFAAQIGTMVLNEEVDAMRTIGVSPMEALVMPRIISAVVMMPLLSFYSSLIAIAGGCFLCAIALEIPPVTFIQRLREVVPLTDIWIGLIKAPVFGLIIGVAGCFQGLQVRGNAEEVGLRTTAAVVQAIFLVIVIDAVFAVFFTWIGWK